MDKQIDKIATEVQEKLLKEGFVIHRYNAYSTNSVYLKLDYGVGNSIRISDHGGKSHLQYRYNILTTIKSSFEETSKDGYPMYFFTKRQITRMTNRITAIKARKIKMHGQNRYDRQIEKYQKDIVNARGFWKQAFEVKEEDKNNE